MSEPTVVAPPITGSTLPATRQARSVSNATGGRRSRSTRVQDTAVTSRRRERSAMVEAPHASTLLSRPGRAEDHATNSRRVRAEARARSENAVRELDAAIDVGDHSYRRLRRRLDDYGTQMQAVRSRLRHAGYLTH